jgi:hypothetical protein
MMAKIVHTAKQTVNAMVDSHSARFCSALLGTKVVGMMRPVPVATEKSQRPQKPGIGSGVLRLIKIAGRIPAASLLYLFGYLT